MKFYDCAPAPSPRRVRIFIAEKGLDIPVVEVDLRSGEQHGDAFTSINSHRTVPVLELDDGSRICNTAGIYAYLEALHPRPALLGETPTEKARIAEMQWRMEMLGLTAVSEVLRKPREGVSGPGAHRASRLRADSGARRTRPAAHRPVLRGARRHPRRPPLRRRRALLDRRHHRAGQRRLRGMGEEEPSRSRRERATLARVGERTTQLEAVSRPVCAAPWTPRLLSNSPQRIVFRAIGLTAGMTRGDRYRTRVSRSCARGYGVARCRCTLASTSGTGPHVAPIGTRGG